MGVLSRIYPAKTFLAGLLFSFLHVLQECDSSLYRIKNPTNVSSVLLIKGLVDTLKNLRLFDDDENLEMDSPATNAESDNSLDPAEESIYQAKLDGQWLLIAALREGLGIALKEAPTYLQTLALADKYENELLGRKQMLFHPDESKGVKKYRERARLLSERKRLELQERRKEGEEISPEEVQKTMVTAQQAIELEMEDLTDLLKSDNGPNPHTRAELVILDKIREELEAQATGTYGEDDIILKDWKRGTTGLPTFMKQGRYRYHNFALPNKRVMRIGMFHPGKAEKITGLDFLFEYHHPMEHRARVVAVQYKLPKGDRKSITIDVQIRNQLNKLSAVFCDTGFCDGPSYDGSVKNRPYCLPACCAFFRPTERLQQASPHIASMGYHLRLCDVDQLCEMSEADNPLLPLEKSKKHGISSSIFEELLCSNRLGSRWITYDQLKVFHKAYEIDIPHEHAGIHIQEAPAPA